MPCTSWSMVIHVLMTLGAFTMMIEMRVATIATIALGSFAVMMAVRVLIVLGHC